MARSSDASSSEKLMDSLVQKNTSADEESAVDPAGTPVESTTTVTIKKKKKIISLQVPEWYVKDVLSYKPVELKEPEVPELIIKHDPVLAASLYMMMADSALYEEYTKEQTLEEQRNFRHQLRTKGRVTREIEVDEDDDRFETVGGSTGGTVEEDGGDTAPAS